MTRKDLTPLVMASSLLAAILILAVIRSSRIPNIWIDDPFNCDTLFISLYLVWMLLEARISWKDKNTEGKHTSDSASCQIYGIGHALTFLSALWFQPVWARPGIAHFAGMTLLVVGIVCRLWAVRSLGEFYSHRVRTVTEHRIIQSGPYRIIRHPAYLGMIVAHTGVLIYFFNWVTMCIFLFLFVPAILLRISIEERLLFGIEGYPEYARNRKRLIPRIW